MGSARRSEQAAVARWGDFRTAVPGESLSPDLLSLLHGKHRIAGLPDLLGEFAQPRVWHLSAIDSAAVREGPSRIGVNLKSGIQ
jgi:hypothetical protein